LAASLPVLTFHALDDQPSVISFPTPLFRRAIARLHESGFHTLDLLEAIDCLQRGVALPQRSVVITFDDGYRSVYEEAFPVLERYGMCATVFLTVGEQTSTEPARRLPSLHGRPMLSWREIREMRSAAITFGAHTLTHVVVTSALAYALASAWHAPGVWVIPQLLALCGVVLLLLFVLGELTASDLSFALSLLKHIRSAQDTGGSRLA